MCGEIKLASEFYRINRHLRHDCKSCHDKSTKRNWVSRFRKLKMKAVEYKGGCCQVCGYSKCVEALEFHHVGKKEFEPSKMLQDALEWSVVTAELDKCVLLCANCHREAHAGQEASMAMQRTVNPPTLVVTSGSIPELPTILRNRKSSPREGGNFEFPHHFAR